MKGKDKKEEVIDITTLPKINIVSNLLLLNFKNHNLSQERRFKILETLYKTTHKLIKLVCRDQLIDFAKEKDIFKESEQRKEINAEELAKAASRLIIDKGIPAMKEKKAVLNKIEETKKQKEDAIYAFNNPQPIDPKKKVDPKAPKILNPDDIIIPVLDEIQPELMIVLYNYPSNEAEYKAFEKEKLTLNMITLVNDKVKNKLKKGRNYSRARNKRPESSEKYSKRNKAYSRDITYAEIIRKSSR